MQLSYLNNYIDEVNKTKLLNAYVDIHRLIRLNDENIKSYQDTRYPKTISHYQARLEIHSYTKMQQCI